MILDWWQALLLAAVPAAITGTSLLLQQQSSNHMERAKIADLANERQHQRELATADRNAERQKDELDHSRRLANDWRLARREAHTRLLNLMFDAHEDLSRLAVADILAASGGQAPRIEVSQFRRDWGASLFQALADVQIISSESAAKAGDAAVSALTRIYYSLTSEKGELRAREKLDELHSSYHNHLNEYTKAARTELAGQ